MAARFSWVPSSVPTQDAVTYVVVDPYIQHAALEPTVTENAYVAQLGTWILVS